MFTHSEHIAQLQISCKHYKSNPSQEVVVHVRCHCYDGLTVVLLSYGTSSPFVCLLFCHNRELAALASADFHTYVSCHLFLLSSRVPL